MMINMDHTRKLNFNAGPAALPPSVLQQAATAVLDYNNSGLSILEIPHRGADFVAIMDESRQLVKELCNLGDDYEVLWLQGGGRLQFCMIPMNFLGPDESAGYIDSGYWAESAYKAAKYYGNAQVLASTKDINYTHLPQWPEQLPAGLQYVHCTTNNTIYGTQLHTTPNIDVPVIADMSSDIFSCTRDYSKYAMFYVTVQKNLGAAGVTLVVLRKDLMERVKREQPDMLTYKAHAGQQSMLNTPPVFAIYVSLLMLRWTKARGINAIDAENRQKAQLLYTEVERNSLFAPVVDVAADRSMMNACFTAKNSSSEQLFTDFCTARNITGIKGHRSVGGFRASMYNAVTLSAVETLVQAMQDFEHEKAI
jgi:phosphoserine aminotransferase